MDLLKKPTKGAHRISLPPLRGLLKKPALGSGGMEVHAVRRGRDGFVGAGLRACPPLRGCPGCDHPAKGQARRPRTTLLGCPATVDNSKIGILSLPCRAFQQPRYGSVCRLERVCRPMRERLPGLMKADCRVDEIAQHRLSDFHLAREETIDAFFQKLLPEA